ncbi:hypothetical protein KB20921_20760 [Edwardsiella ictaluri]|nr:hypothetical protein KH20906_20520 [Edwardsiella ictaluri]BEI02815.1 hypothetical protein KB20921_20760 [Edwardsiella ictaluri]BEI06277.1 hypothetical protein KH201010_20630 [Edwardsiella ictaluri]BEI09737.1 hypothetical protein STU22726_20680 [Edwardsiella ictaluri]BEI13217.1 hypothetical protein STU22816_20700 [Edwardsiella ictaluri]
MKAVDADGGLAEVDLLDTQVGQWADYGFAALLMQTAHQDHIAAGLFQQMGDIGADGDPRDLFTLGQIARQQGVGAAAFDKNGLSVTEQGGRIGGQLLLQGEVNHHAGVEFPALQGDGKTMHPPKVAALFQQRQILTNGDFGNPEGAGQVSDADR